MKIQKKQFRIGTLAQELGLEKFVVRFWEKEFDIKSSRSSGGQRYYTLSDVEKFKQIKDLLYTKKFTIAGAKDALCCSPNKVIGSKKTVIDNPHSINLNKNQLMHLRNKLIALKELL
jgi:DNA-binding transcriptional MerR regulator